MAAKYKTTISVVLVLVLCKSQNVKSEDSPRAIVSSLPGEHLLRGSSEHDSREDDKPSLEAVTGQTDQTFVTHQHELSFNNEGNAERHDRPNVFLNAEEAKSIQMTGRDLFGDSNEQSDYLMRPTDLTLKSLQEFYVPEDSALSQTTETVESAVIANPVALNLSPGEIETEEGTQKTDMPLAGAAAMNISRSEVFKDIPKITPTQEDVVNNPTDINVFQSSQDSLTETNNPASINEANKQTTAESPESKLQTTEIITTVSDDTATANDVTDAQTEDEEAGVYKPAFTTSKTMGYGSNSTVESITRGNMPRSEPLTSRESNASTLSPEDEVSGGIGARLGLDKSLLASVVESTGQQRTSKLKATPRPKVKLSKRDTLRSWLQDPWLRSPIGILVPLKARSISRALAVWTEVTSPEGLNLTDVLVIGYDENGIGWLSKHNLQNDDGVKNVANALQKLLLKHQSVMSDVRDKGDAALHACAWAAKLVPYDSALFIVTDSAPSDAQRLPAALRAIIDKRLKLYTIWTDPLYPSAASEQAAMELMKASTYTEGEFLDFHPVITAANEAGNMASEQTSWSHSMYRTTADMIQRVRAGKTDNGIHEKYETLLVRRTNGGGAAALGVPVEEGIESLRVRIDGRIDRATFYPPTGPQIDLFNATSVSGFAPGSRLESSSPLEAFLLFPPHQDDRSFAVLPSPDTTAEKTHRKPTVGLWRLSIRCNGCEYRVVVTAQAPIGLDVTMIGEDLLRLRARGPIASVRETTLIDEYGTELAKLPFSHQPSATEEGLDTSAVGDGSGMPSLVADVPLPSVKRSSKVYARVVGRDIYGESFTRLAGPIFKAQEVRTSRSAAVSFPDGRGEALQSASGFPDERDALPDDRSQRLLFGNNQTTVVPSPIATSQISSQAGTLLTTVQIGLSTRLYGTPGDNLQLHFEVTNYRERSINFRFEASGNLRFLRGIRPTTQWINAGQTANVIVDVGITTNAQVGARDLITFTATGLEQVSISAYVYVTSPEIGLVDTWAPNVRHTFQGDCMTKQGDDCARHTWAVTIYARDNDGGLLRLSSSPVGLRYESNFVAGTREEVTATYRATCCATRILVNAVDTNGNANTYTVDVSNYIPDAAIAAIALGVLLMLALIALVVFLVYLCVRRRRESRQLPSYATPRREA